MQLQDIFDAVAEKDVSAIRDGFRALVGYPHEVEIAQATDEGLSEALGRVCAALEGDEAIMPSRTIDLINDRSKVEDADRLPYGSSYSAGSAMVGARPEIWAQRFATFRQRQT